MNRLLVFTLIAFNACSPESPPAPSAPAAQIPASVATAPAPSADAILFPKLGWTDNKYAWEGKPFTGTTEEAWKKTGKLKLRYQIKDGVYHGLVEEWHENGNKKTHTSYEAGKHEGDNFYWNADGSLQAHKVWKNDTKISETPGPKQP